MKEMRKARTRLGDQAILLEDDQERICYLKEEDGFLWLGVMGWTDESYFRLDRESAKKLVDSLSRWIEKEGNGK